jgi:hypothetical protein
MALLKKAMMEPVQDVDCCRCVLRDDLKARLPHVRTYVLEIFRSFLRKPGKKALDRLFSPMLANPQKPSASRVDLIDKSPILVPLPPHDFVDSDRRYPGKINVTLPPLDSRFYGSIYSVPACLKSLGCILPGQALRPTRKEHPKLFVIRFLPSAHGTSSTVTPHHP